MPRFTLEEHAVILYQLQEAEWRNYEESTQELKDLGWIHKPDERLTLQQWIERVKTRGYHQTFFTMDKVVTGTRRKWQRS